MRRSCAFGLALLLLACAGSSGPSREETIVTTLRARVAAVDPTTRLVTLVNEAGDRKTFRADEAVRNLGQMQVGDEVVGTLVESIAIEVRKATPEELANRSTVEEGLATAAHGQKPAGVYVRQAKEIFTIAAIDKKMGGGELRDARGGLHFVKVRDPAVLDRVTLGDTVVVTYTEAFSLQVVAPVAPAQGYHR